MNTDEEQKYVFKPLAEHCPLEAFSSDEAEIDKWLWKKSWDHHCFLISRVTTVHLGSDDRPVAFYAFYMTLEDDRFPDKHSHVRRRSIGRYFPALQVQYVAVHKDHQARGAGTIIMRRILEIFRNSVVELGVPAMTLVALNPRAAKLYLRMGFVSYGGPGSSRMLLPAQSVLDLPSPDAEHG